MPRSELRPCRGRERICGTDAEIRMLYPLASSRPDGLRRVIVPIKKAVRAAWMPRAQHRARSPLARIRSALYGITVLIAPLASAERADDNAVTAAEDAFGSTLGNESIGLYTNTQVRGFSPLAAGNVRIEGLYFDRQGSVSPRLTEGSTIHVGLSAQGYPFPAPTGIVDYRLRKAGDERVLSVVAGYNPYLAPSIELDGQLPVVAQRLGIAAGISFAREEYYDGSDARYWRAAVAPRWRPSEHVDIIPFWEHIRGRDEETVQTIITAGPYPPPAIARRHYFGQSWADDDTDSTTYGLLGKARIGADWAVSGGVFRSISDTRGFADLYVGTQPDGATRELVIADPRQRYASTSGEVRLARSVVTGERLHVVHLSLRAREQDNRYGGSAPTLDLGPRRLGETIPATRPDRFDFGERTHDEARQRSVGLAYEGRWRGVGEASLGIQRVHYEKQIEPPGLPPVSAADRPWLPSATLAAYLTPAIALYAGYTRGLEGNGLAPDNAANRNEALPAIRTRQQDAGVRWNVTRDLKLIAGAFEVEKSYFTTDEHNVYTAFGRVRHRGVELSFTGALSPSLSVVAGAVLMEPRVTGAAVEAGRVGDQPVGQTDRILKTNLDYRLRSLPALSFDVAVSNYGARVASSDNRSSVPGYTNIDLGARYRLTFGATKATLRLQALNVTDVFTWNVIGNNSFRLTDGRRYAALLYVDL